MYSITKIIALLPVLFLLTNCQPNPPKSSDKLSETPQLLDRNEGLWNGKEWDNVQNQYVAYRDAIVNDNQAAESRLGLAGLFIQEARVTGEHGHYYPAALQVLEEALEITQEKDVQFRALAAKAGVQLSLHQFEGALSTAQAAIALNPYNAQIYGVLVDAYVELGNYEKAVEMADRMVAIRPDIRSYARVSYLREIHGLTEGAIEAMKMAIAAGQPGTEETSWARLTLGELYQQYGQPKEAAYQYRMALAERPDYPFATAAIASLKMEEKDYETAEHLLKTACASLPEVGFYHQLAHLYQLTNRKEEKEATVALMLPMLEDDVANGHLMDMEYAALYDELVGDYDTALGYALKEYQRRPKNIDVNRLLARIYLHQGKHQLAMQHLEKARSTQSKHPELRDLQSALAAL